jgi:predicted metal-dependent RNase
MTTDFFRNLYTSEGTRNLDAVLDTVLVKVTTDMNTSLMVPFSEKEVKEALFQMFPTKAGQVQNQQQNRITEHHPGTS